MTDITMWIVMLTMRREGPYPLDKAACYGPFESEDAAKAAAISGDYNLVDWVASVHEINAPLSSEDEHG